MKSSKNSEIVLCEKCRGQGECSQEVEDKDERYGYRRCYDKCPDCNGSGRVIITIITVKKPWKK